MSEPSASFRAGDARFLRVYDALREIAVQRLASAHAADSLQATGLVHEAWLKLQVGASVDAEDTEHFFATAAQAMRWILVDRARRRLTQKRKHVRASVELGELAQQGQGESDADFVLDLDRALVELEELDARKCEVVMLRHFAGRSVEETAKELGISKATVKREWAFARAWLLRAMDGASEPS